MKHYKSRYFMKTIRIHKFKICTSFGICLNNLHSGNCGFSLFLGDLLVWHQAWFGSDLNEVTWWHGKFNIKFPFLDIQYSPNLGWTKY